MSESEECPICGSEELTPLITSASRAHSLKCKKCGAIFLSGEGGTAQPPVAWVLDERI